MKRLLNLALLALILAVGPVRAAIFVKELLVRLAGVEVRK